MFDPSLIRAKIAAPLRRRKLLVPLAIFALVCGVYAASWLAIFAVPLAAAPIAALLNGLAIGLLFVVGHDACHGSFVPVRWLNAALGRLAFLPSLHPYTFWELGHNRVHHGWTNLKGKDYVWAPFSVEEFAALPASRKVLERVGRTLPGAGLHYGALIWWARMVSPRREDRARVSLLLGRFDRALVAAFALAEVAAALAIEGARHDGGAPLSLLRLALALVAPLATCHWLIGVVTFLHHNHPRVRWYDQRDDWSFARGSLQGTVRVVPASAVDSLLLHIMAHTAHHVDTHVPLYHLPAAQRSLEVAYPADVIREKLSWSSVLGAFRDCKLYDYRRQLWLDYSGNATAGGEKLRAIARATSPMVG